MVSRRAMILASATAIMVLAAACIPLVSRISSWGDTRYTRITVRELKSMLEDKDFVLVNTHVPYDGEIPQTDLFIPFDEMERFADEIPDKSARIVVYGRGGSMSSRSAQKLVSLGYTNVFEVRGGMLAWRNARYELVER